MKTISTRLDDDDYAALDDMLDDMGQTKQTFYETFTKTVLREHRIPFIIRGLISKHSTANNKAMDSFAKLEALRKSAGQYQPSDFDPDIERGKALDEKYGSID